MSHNPTSQTPHPDSYCRLAQLRGHGVDEAWVLLPDDFKKDDAVNWPLLLQTLRRAVDDSLMRIAVSLAQTWITCACGSQCDVLPRDAYGEPRDRQLRTLGTQFMGLMQEAYEDPASSSDHLNKAAEVLAQIEQRSTELLKQLPSCSANDSK